MIRSVGALLVLVTACLTFLARVTAVDQPLQRTRTRPVRPTTPPAPRDAAPQGTTRVTTQAPASRHGPIAQLLISWSPLSVILVVYAAAERVNSTITVGDTGSRVNRLGFHLHVGAPAHVDERVFGAVPNVWLQHQLFSSSGHWYDAVAALVYVTHFVAFPIVTGLVWFRLRDRFAAWLIALLTFTALGVGGYVVYPAAPPWLASDQGVIGTVHRISGLGWGYLHLPVIEKIVEAGQAGSNPVAAMPSLHAGTALLVALFLWPVAGWLWRTALLAYVVLMALALVYTGEHYVVDVAAGWVVAGAAVGLGAALRRRRLGRALRSTSGSVSPAG